MSTEEYIVRIENASIYQRDNLVLSDVNLKIRPGEFVYVIGKVGTGKSSLIRTLNAELPLMQGDGRVAGYDLAKIKSRDVPFLRRKVGVVFQDFKLLTDRTIFKNFEFILHATGWKEENRIQARIVEVLDSVGMTDSLNKMPHQLSGGEQQRVVIARALLNNPDLILADEPTGNLDPETSDALINLLRRINKEGKTIIMASHDYFILQKYPARTLICENNKVVDFEGELREDVDFESLLDKQE
ncbi:MAG: ATP-binding cassette domain-containing protein [Bacteroidota bacterium]|nr:ATP-binding cassette domain-containing protein [Bacteroidota bacterium]